MFIYSHTKQIRIFCLLTLDEVENVPCDCGLLFKLRCLGLLHVGVQGKKETSEGCSAGKEDKERDGGDWMEEIGGREQSEGRDGMEQACNGKKIVGKVCG